MGFYAGSRDDNEPVFLKTSFTGGIYLDCHGDSRIGRGRTINQDRCFIMPLMESTFLESNDPSHAALPDPLATTRGFLFGVADGVGGAPSGERASLLVVGTLKAFLQEESTRLIRAGRSDGEILEMLRRGLRRCQAALVEAMRRHPEYWGMGTTLTAAVALWPKLYLVHLGDSRAYLLREGILRRLTRDHTHAQALVEAGVLDTRNVEHSRWKHVLRNMLGGKASGQDPEVHPEVHVELLRRNDVLLFCTDGLTSRLTDETIRGLLVQEGSSEYLCRTLTDSSWKTGATDDTAALVAQFKDSTPALDR